MKIAVTFVVNFMVLSALFIFFVFMFPYLYVLATSQKVLDIAPELLGVTIFSAYIGNHRITSEVGPMGLILVLLAAALLTALTHYRSQVKTEQENGNEK